VDVEVSGKDAAVFFRVEMRMMTNRLGYISMSISLLQGRKWERANSLPTVPIGPGLDYLPV
jgi:hypothetical protein